VPGFIHFDLGVVGEELFPSIKMMVPQEIKEQTGQDSVLAEIAF
jgi:hypothetical protein